MVQAISAAPEGRQLNNIAPVVLLSAIDVWFGTIGWDGVVHQTARLSSFTDPWACATFVDPSTYACIGKYALLGLVAPLLLMTWMVLINSTRSKLEPLSPSLIFLLLNPTAFAILFTAAAFCFGVKNGYY